MEARTRELLAALPDAILAVDSNGCIAFANTAAHALFRYPPDGLKGALLDTLVPGGLHSLPPGSNHLAGLRHRPSGLESGLSARRHDGVEFPVEISLSPVDLDDQHLALVTIRPVSESEEFYRGFFEQLAVGIVHSDPNGMILDVNRKFCELSGYTREELLTLGISHLTHPEDLPNSLAGRTRILLGTETDYEREVRMIGKSGAQIWTRITTSLLRPGDHSTARFVSLIQDITAQKRAEEDRRESDLRFRQVTENIHEVFWLTDAQKREILYVSPGYSLIWGRSADSLYASPNKWIDFIHADDRPRILEAAQIKQVRGDYDEEYRIIRPDGSIRWIRDRAFPVRGEDLTVVRIAGVAEDITDRKQAMEELTESERRFREILGKVELVSLMLDREGRITYCNEYLLRLTGWTAAEVAGMSWFERFLPADTVIDVRDTFTALLAGHPDAWHHENEILTRCGNRRLIAWNNIVLRSVAGDVIGTASIGEDVTERKRAAALHARLAAIVESSDDAIIAKSLDGVITSWNTGAEKLFGYSVEETIGNPITLIIPPEYLPEEQSILQRLSNGQRITHFETRRKHKDGTPIDVALTISPVYDAEGQVVGASTIARDITQRKQADLRIQHLNRVYAVLSATNALIVRVRSQEELFREACRIAVEVGQLKLAWLGLVDRATLRVDVCAWHGVEESFVRQISDQLGLAASARNALPYALDDWQGVTYNDVARELEGSLQRELLARGLLSATQLPLLVEGKIVGILALYAGETGFFDEEEMKLFRELAADIAFALDHIDKAKRADYLALYDQLTGLANRALFLERLNQHVHAARVAGESLAVVLADVERLRMVNDSLGRQSGDEILRQLVERLSLGADRARLARIESDAFAIVLQGPMTKAAVERRIEAMWRETFGQAFRVAGVEIRTSAKAGISLFPDDAGDAESLLRNAEAALRKAKETGETFVFHSVEMTERSSERLTLETELRQALENDQLVLYYQPKVELETRRIVGVEALIRWNSPERGLVPPAQFIPFMEETGLILEAGAWALSRAVADHHRWAQLGLPAMPVAVNVSSIQLRKRDFVETVATAVNRVAGSAPIELEITESTVMEDVAENIGKLKELRRLGVALAIDDFGTGYSSLGYLTKLPVQTLKIDRSFVKTMLEDRDTMALVQTIISLAGSLRLKVVAEGVETEEQAKILRLLRCDEMQGFLVSRPVPFEDIVALLRRGSDD